MHSINDIIYIINKSIKIKILESFTMRQFFLNVYYNLSFFQCFHLSLAQILGIPDHQFPGFAASQGNVSSAEENPKAGKCLKTTDLTIIVFLSGAARQCSNEKEKQKSGCIMYLMHHTCVPAVEVGKGVCQTIQTCFATDSIVNSSLTEERAK